MVDRIHPLAKVNFFLAISQKGPGGVHVIHLAGERSPSDSNAFIR
jgi:hypothetical protein